MEHQTYFHSVTLNKDLCHGCITCVKRCPTEAIRVRDGKARILGERCIDWRVHPHLSPPRQAGCQRYHGGTGWLQV